MRRYHFEIENVRSQARTLWIVIGIESVIVLALAIGLMRAPHQLTVHIPPDLRSGATVRAGAPHPANVYSFTAYIFQQLNRWPMDGAADFGEAIYSLAPYLTPSFREMLIADMESRGRNGELALRERAVQSVPGQAYHEARVDVIGDEAWVVWLDLELTESIRGMEIKRKSIRYPLRVVRYEIDPESNPWGLALDGYADPGPQEITNRDQANPS